MSGSKFLHVNESMRSKGKSTRGPGLLSYHTLTGRMKVVGTGQYGTFTPHNHVALQLDVPSVHGPSEYYTRFFASIDKFKPQDMSFFEEKMRTGESIEVTIDEHVIGNPLKGLLMFPVYIRSASEVNDK